MFLKTKSVSPWPWRAPRRVVRWFAGLMEQVLRDNDYKGGWTLDRPGMGAHFFLAKLDEETRELWAELYKVKTGAEFDPAHLAREAADVANVAMMIADNWGRKPADLGPVSHKPESADYSSFCQADGHYDSPSPDASYDPNND